MTGRSIQSYSSSNNAAINGTEAEARTNNQKSKSTRKQEKQISELLSQSLAVSLSRVDKKCGNDTAKGILDILQDECFDIISFRKEISSIQKCQDITNALVDISMKSKRYLIFLLLPQLLSRFYFILSLSEIKHFRKNFLLLRHAVTR